MFASAKKQLKLTALVAALLAAPFANAAIVYTDLSASTIKITNSINGTYLNVVNGDSGQKQGNVAGWDINAFNDGSGLTFFTPSSGAIRANVNGALALNFNQQIGPNNNFTSGVVAGTGFQVTGEEYLGFSFFNELTGATNYGWALISTTQKPGNNTGFPSEFLGYAYENTGAAIRAGATGDAVALPEPGSVALFGLGLAGLAAFARRRSV